MERLATGAWLDRPLVRAASAFSLVVSIAALLYLYANSTGTLDSWGRPLGTDFSNVWTAGRMVGEGRAAEAYDWAAHYRVQKEVHGSEAVPFYGWLYPPPFLLVAAALATMPYLVALLVFQLSTLGAALLVLRAVWPDRDLTLAALGCPAVLVCLTHGHNGFLTAALFGAGLLLLDRRPVVAGLCFGLLCYKPQFGLLVPLALGLGGYWRTVAAAGATVAILCAATTLCLEPEVWSAFAASLGPTRTVILEAGGPGWPTMQSAFAAVRLWGGSVALAYAAQAAVAAAAAAGVALLWFGRAPFATRAAALTVCSLLSTPYVMDYDLVLLGPAIAFLGADAGRSGARRWEASALALAWFVPLAGRQAAGHFGLPLGVLAMAWLFGLAIRRGIGSLRPDRAVPLPS